MPNRVEDIRAKTGFNQGNCIPLDSLLALQKPVNGYGLTKCSQRDDNQLKIEQLTSVVGTAG